MGHGFNSKLLDSQRVYVIIYIIYTPMDPSFFLGSMAGGCLKIGDITMGFNTNMV